MKILRDKTKKIFVLFVFFLVKKILNYSYFQECIFQGLKGNLYAGNSLSEISISIAFGDADGDGFDEVGVTRYAGSNARYIILDDANAGFIEILAGGTGWGGAAYATSIAFGNVDNDSSLEFGVARRAGSGARYMIFEDANNGFILLHEGGHGWGGAAYATDIAFGNVDGDGYEEAGITRRAGSNARYIIIDDDNAASPYSELYAGGTDWGPNAYATAISFGDVDNDGYEEIGIARMAGENGRFFVVDDSANSFNAILSWGAFWGASAYATDVAFGNVNSDANMELGVTRRSGMNARYMIYNPN